MAGYYKIEFDNHDYIRGLAGPSGLAEDTPESSPRSSPSTVVHELDTPPPIDQSFFDKDTVEDDLVIQDWQLEYSVIPPSSSVQEMANNNAFPALDNTMNSPSRSSTSSPAPQVNGNGGSYSNNYIPPLPVGHQQDLNFLYQQIQELSGLLQSNREKVNDVTRSAEEVAVSNSS